MEILINSVGHDLQGLRRAAQWTECGRKYAAPKHMGTLRTAVGHMKPIKPVRPCLAAKR